MTHRTTLDLARHVSRQVPLTCPSTGAPMHAVASALFGRAHSELRMACSCDAGSHDFLVIDGRAAIDGGRH